MARAEMGAAGAYLALSGRTDAVPAQVKRPNIIFILQDDQRYDAIGCPGNPPWLKTPKMIKSGTVRDELVLNVDFAPSMIDVAGLPIPSYMQGKSFKPLLEGRKTSWREDFLYNYHLEIDLSKMNAEEKAAFDKRWRGQGLDPSPLLVPENRAVRTKEWKYITYPGIDEIDELYNLKNDPYEMKNLASDPKHADVVKKMKARMAKLLEETK